MRPGVGGRRAAGCAGLRAGGAGVRGGRRVVRVVRPGVGGGLAGRGSAAVGGRNGSCGRSRRPAGCCADRTRLTAGRCPGRRRAGPERPGCFPAARAATGVVGRPDCRFAGPGRRPRPVVIRLATPGRAQPAARPPNAAPPPRPTAVRWLARRRAPTAARRKRTAAGRRRLAPGCRQAASPGRPPRRRTSCPRPLAALPWRAVLFDLAVLPWPGTPPGRERPPALCSPALCPPALCSPALCSPALCSPALCPPALGRRIRGSPRPRPAGPHTPRLAGRCRAGGLRVSRLPLPPCPAGAGGLTGPAAAPAQGDEADQ